MMCELVLVDLETRRAQHPRTNTKRTSTFSIGIIIHKQTKMYTITSYIDQYIDKSLAKVGCSYIVPTH